MKIPAVATKDLITVTDLTRDEIFRLFQFSFSLKKDLRAGKRPKLLEGKSMAMIFEKNSTRTRVSFEVGMTQLGGHSLFLSGDDIQLGRGETIKDTAMVLSRYVDGIMIRTYSHDKVVELARNSSVPVINGLTDSFHPCQALADLFTIYEREKDLSRVKLAYVGDGNNVAHSLLQAAALIGVNIAVASPKEYMCEQTVIESAYNLSSLSGAAVTITDSVREAVADANYIYTDVWVSMGQENSASKKIKALSGYKISAEVMKQCAPACRVMHCLPAHRGEEIDADILDSASSVVFEQAENRLHIQKAIMCALMGKQ